jgi:hypothetical protein
MKKVILVLAILTVTLTSCGGGESEAPKTDSTAVVVVDTIHPVKPVETATVVAADSTKEVK